MFLLGLGEVKRHLSLGPEVKLFTLLTAAGCEGGGEVQ